MRSAALKSVWVCALLARTTRSVAPTDAGEQFLVRLRPALADIRGAQDEIAGSRDRPGGPLRVVASPLAARMVLAPKLAEFASNFPDVILDLTTIVSRVDLVAAHADAMPKVDARVLGEIPRQSRSGIPLEVLWDA